MKRALAESKGAFVEHVQRIPFRNYLGQEIGFKQWAIVYAHTEPLEMDVKT